MAVVFDVVLERLVVLVVEGCRSSGGVVLVASVRGCVCGGSGWVRSGVRRGLALWGIVFRGMVGVALEYVARGMLVVVAGEVSVYMVEVGGVAVLAYRYGRVAGARAGGDFKLARVAGRSGGRGPGWGDSFVLGTG